MATRASPSGGIVAGDPITAAETNKAAGGWIGFVHGVTGHDFTTDEKLFEVLDVPIRAGRLTKVTVSIPRLQMIGGTGATLVKIWVEANGATIFALYRSELVASETSQAFGSVSLVDSMAAWGALTPGAIDFAVWGNVTGSGTARMPADALPGDPGGQVLVVEDLGSFPT